MSKESLGKKALYILLDERHGKTEKWLVLLGNRGLTGGVWRSIQSRSGSYRVKGQGKWGYIYTNGTSFTTMDSKKETIMADQIIDTDINVEHEERERQTGCERAQY